MFSAVIISNIVAYRALGEGEVAFLIIGSRLVVGGGFGVVVVVSFSDRPAVLVSDGFGVLLAVVLAASYSDSYSNKSCAKLRLCLPRGLVNTNSKTPSAYMSDCIEWVGCFVLADCIEFVDCIELMDCIEFMPVFITSGAVKYTPLISS